MTDNRRSITPDDIGAGLSKETPHGRANALRLSLETSIDFRSYAMQWAPRSMNMTWEGRRQSDQYPY